MIDLGDVHPEATMGKMRTKDGMTILDRLTTTEEQRAEVIERLTVAVAQRGRDLEARATVHWSRGEPSVLEVTFTKEHIEGKPVYLPAQVVEQTTGGAVILPSEQARLRTLGGELLDLHERGML